jgi:hypothetical protein
VRGGPGRGGLPAGAGLVVVHARVVVLAVRDLDLDVPRLLEPAHREGDQQELHRDDQQGDEADDALVQRGRAEAGLVAVEPLRARDGGEDPEDDRQRGRDRQHAAVPARDVEGHDQVEEDVADLDDLHTGQLRPSAERHDEDQPGRGEQEQDHDGLRGLRRGLLLVGVLNVVPLPNLDLLHRHGAREHTDRRRGAQQFPALAFGPDECVK